MGVIMKLRQKGVAIIIFIALFAFLIGGLLQSGSLFNKQVDYIAKVNGTKIKYLDYQKEIDQAEQFYKILQNKNSLEPDLIRQIQQQVWNTMLSEALLKPTIEQLGITVSKEELWDMVQGKNISPIIKQIFVNENGVFDKNLLINFLQNKDQDPKANFLWLYLEKQIKEQRLYEKYNTLAIKSIFANKLEAQDNYFGRKNIADIEVAGKVFYEIPDSVVKYTEADLKKYYNEHKKLFYQYEETRDLAYVVFEVKPSKKDSLEAYNYCLNLKKDFAKAKNNEEFIKMNAENPIYPRFYSAKELSDIGLDSSVMDLPIDTVIGPYLDDEFYKLAKIIAKEERPDTVSAEHILISPQNPKVKTLDRAKQIADSLLTIIENGGDFKTLAFQYSDDPSVKQNGGLYENFTEGKMVKEFNDYCFSHKVGDIGIVKTIFGYHIVKIVKQSPKVPKVKIGIIDSKISISEDTYNAEYRIVGKFRTECKDTSDFYNLAGKYQVPIRQAPNLSKGTMQIPGLGENSRELIRWVFKSQEGQISDIKRFDNKYVVAVVSNVNPEGYKKFEKIKKELIKNVIIEKKVEYLYNQIKDKSANDLETIAKNIGVEITTTPNVSFSAYQINKFGYEPAILAQVPSIETNKIYGAIKGKNGAYFFRATRTVKAEQPTQEVIKQTEKSISFSYQNKIRYSLFNTILHKADFIDNRPEFF